MSVTSQKRILLQPEVERLNTKYKKFSIQQRVETLYRDFNPEEIMLTSSFAATSAFLLKIFSVVNPQQPVYFIDTGFHFEETLIYKDQLSHMYNLKVRSLNALKEEHLFTVNDKTWEKNPDFCCYINKVKPLDLIKQKYTVWVSGLMEWQSDHRASLNIFENRGEILKFYPLLDVSKDERDSLIEKHKLPFHPLKDKGYHSIGCTHCTSPGEDRDGRWNNNPKTECGLHL